MRVRSLVLAILLSLVAGRALAQTPPGIHAEELEAHRGEAPSLTGDEEIGVFAASTPTVTREVLGFYPYWVGGYDGFHWDLMTEVSYFSAEVDTTAKDGSLGDLHGWGTSTDALIQTAHAAGVRVTLTVTLFDGPTISSILQSPAKRTNLVQNLLDLVIDAGGDGVCIDFEGVPGGSANKTGLVALMSELTDAFHAAIPGSWVTIATPAVDWQGVFDYDQLALNSDGLVIMAYGYHWSGGDPGPVSPLSSGSVWGTHNVAWTVNDYVTWGGSENRDRFLLGLPFYGRDWPSTSHAIPGTATGTGSAVTYANARSRISQHGSSWDADSQTPFVFYTSGGYRQLWYDDDQSLGLKFDLVNDEDLGGIAIWALNYEGSTTEIWDAIDERFGSTGCTDGDGDGHPDAACGGSDCDDGDPAVNPDAPEACGNGIDDDCDTQVDEQCGGCASTAQAAALGGGPPASRAGNAFGSAIPLAVPVLVLMALRRSRRGRRPTEPRGRR